MESNLDFLCITESWLNCNVSTDRVNIPVIGKTEPQVKLDMGGFLFILGSLLNVLNLVLMLI